MRRVFRFLFVPALVLLLVLILGLASLVVLSATAHACSCGLAGTAEQDEVADHVLVGTADARAEAGNGVEHGVTGHAVPNGDAGDKDDKVSVGTRRGHAACGLEPLLAPGVAWVF